MNLWEEHDDESLSEGGTWLLDLVAAVDHLNRGPRSGFTVWDAFEEAIRWWFAERQLASSGADGEPPWDEPDPLTATLQRLLADIEEVDVPTALQQAVRRWVYAMAAHYNAGGCWPHPAPRRGVPPPLIRDLQNTEPREPW